MTDPDANATRVWLDSVDTGYDDAWKRALDYGEALRRKRDMAGMVVSVDHVRGHLYYLYLESAS